MVDDLDKYKALTYDLLNCAFEVHRHVGKGLRETYYEHALLYELRSKGYHVENQVIIPALYKGVQIEDAYKIDILLENSIPIEIKAVAKTLPENIRQLQTYMSVGAYELGYVMNFGAKDFCVGKTLDIDPHKGIYRLIRPRRHRLPDL